VARCDSFERRTSIESVFASRPQDGGPDFGELSRVAPAKPVLAHPTSDTDACHRGQSPTLHPSARFGRRS
jgi:hypothetical protein